MLRQATSLDGLQCVDSSRSLSRELDAFGLTREIMTQIRHDWSLEEIRELHDLPVLDLIHRAALVHREFHDSQKVQVCKLISIKTGGCPEDCAYCAQSSRYDTGITPQRMLDKSVV